MSKDVQNQSFIEAGNVPSYKGADGYINSLVPGVDVPADVVDLAKAQTGMNIYGIPQPFNNGIKNTYYYSKSAPDVYLSCVKNTNGAGKITLAIREILWKMEYIWKHGTNPKTYPASYPSESTSKK